MKTKSFILLAALFFACSKGKGAMKDFIDPKSGINFSAIMKTYPGLKELKNEDLKLKNDGYHNYEVLNKDKKIIRTNAIFEVFSDLTKKGMDLSDFISRLKINSWIKKDNFDIVEGLGGIIPIKFVDGNTHAVLRFANYPPQAVAIYFRLSGVSNKDELFSYIKDYPAFDISIPHKLKGFKVVEAALFMEIEVPTKQVVIFKDWILDINQLTLGNIENQKMDTAWDVGQEEIFWNKQSNITDFPVWSGGDKNSFYKRIILGNLTIKPIEKDNLIIGSKISFVDKNKKMQWEYETPLFGNFIKVVLPVEEEKIFITIFHNIATGSALFCLDLKTGKQIWKADVKQFNVDHSKYKNEVFVKKISDKIILAGDEAGGCYLQVFDVNTGKSLFSRLNQE